MKNFQEFLNESENTENRVIDLFASLARNYETKRPFYTDLFQFNVDEERKDWKKGTDEVELEKTKEIKSTYKIKYTQDEKQFIVKIDFVFFIKGQQEKDAPETMSSEDRDRLNIVLENIKIENIQIKSTVFNTKVFGKDLTPSIKKACEPFLVKVLEDDYDSLGNEIYRIEH